MDISRETPEQTDGRLRRVIRTASLHTYDQPFSFQEFPLERFPELANPAALALIRDDTTWSQLLPTPNGVRTESYCVFRFHFPSGADNSGFVGWLASHLKRKFGTGVFVTCGQNSRAGGIFDYWGVPIALADDVVAELVALRAGKT